MQMFKGHPKALFLIATLQMWESFSYYGMRAILILFLTSSLSYSDDGAYTLYAVYISLIEIGGVLGGFLADRFFGARKSIYIGAIIVTIGHLSMMAIPFTDMFLYVGLSLIAAGSALFRVNCATLLGEFYDRDDPKLQAGFTIYYSSLNLGAFIATIICGYAAEIFGWHIGFSLAGFGMLLGLCIFIGGRSLLEDKGLRVAKTKSKVGIYLVMLTIPLSYCVISYSQISMQILPIVLMAILIGATFRAAKQSKNIYLILAATLLLSLFYACEELMGTSLVLFAERFVDRSIFGIKIPSATLTSVNPITIILIGLLLSRYLTSNTTIHSFKYISYSFLIMCAAFMLLLFGNIGSLIATFVLIATAELFIGPVVYALCVRLAPANMQGLSMGMVMLGYSLAGITSGYLGRFLMVAEDGTADVNSFYSGFTTIALFTSLTGLMLLIGIIMRVKLKRTS